MSGLNAIEMSGSNGPFKAPCQGGSDGEPDRDESTRARRFGGYEPRAAPAERQSEAAELLHLSERQVRRIQRRLEAEGDGAVVHRLRGRPSNRQLSGKLREPSPGGLRERAFGFRSDVRQARLEERGLIVSPGTLRRWLTALGLWQRHRRRDQHRSRRPRRECFGELVQMDASIHAGLEGPGKRWSWSR